ncbi:hypothetical protein [Arthrobacter sp. NicSoilB8]|uniref:hypothetical protein n=1 Tax=Arthrobacter sp. NicSoilB8 TaxID=2830998 RepID=UPI001CC8121F|nr:hypothetical protein [Arthrobacter sp. NicSoilB8]BCW72407.1 hypothetical protein NicSoilB8_34510 [Arthrobacter sp. NicSoilB8]
MKNRAIRLGIAGALTALSLAALSLAGPAGPAQADELMHAIPPAPADPCGPVADFVRFCTAPDGHRYPVTVSGAVVPGKDGTPGIGGALQIGSTLTVVDGSWDPTDAMLTHQWLRDDVPVPGATGPTYLLTTADLDKGIRVDTTATAPGYARTTLQSAKTTPVTNAGAAVPSLVAENVYFGTPSDNPDMPGVLVYGGGIFKGAPDVHRQYQWLRDGKPIPGATARMFDATGWGPTGLLSVRVTGHAPGFNPATGTSKAENVSNYNPTPATVVTGGTGLGDVLTGTDDVPWSFKPFEHHFRWLRDGVAIAGATALTYKITAQDQGHTLVLRTDELGFDGTHPYSNRVVVPAAAGVELKQLTNVTKPVVTGTAVTGSVMKVSAGTWSVPADTLNVTFDWLIPGREKPVSGAAFTPDQPQIGRTLSVLVTASAPGYTTAWVEVTAPKPVTARVSTRAISGTLTVGSKVTLTPDPWYDRIESDLLWRRDGVPIAGAYGWSYVLARADAGRKLSVSVSPIMSGGMYQTLNASARVAGLPLVSATPTIAGTVKAGNVLTVKRGTWTWGTAFKYRWLRNGVPISGAWYSTYKVRSADKGAKITVRVTGSRFGYTTVSRTSGARIAG